MAAAQLTTSRAFTTRLALAITDRMKRQIRMENLFDPVLARQKAGNVKFRVSKDRMMVKGSPDRQSLSERFKKDGPLRRTLPNLGMKMTERAKERPPIKIGGRELRSLRKPAFRDEEGNLREMVEVSSKFDWR